MGKEVIFFHLSFYVSTPQQEYSIQISSEVNHFFAQHLHTIYEFVYFNLDFDIGYMLQFTLYFHTMISNNLFSLQAHLKETQLSYMILLPVYGPYSKNLLSCLETLHCSKGSWY